MRRPLASLAGLLVALAVLVSTAPAASATATIDVIVGRPDGTFRVDEVPAPLVESRLDRLRDMPGVAWAELDTQLHAAGDVTPADPLYADQWGAALVGAPQAWGRSTGDASTVIAVVDTGVNPSEPDLAGALLPGADFVGDGTSGDPNGHGTWVARVAAARANDGIGIAGYCWTCQILPVRALDANGGGSASGVASAVRWAAEHGADIINLSLAGPESNVALASAIDYARSFGVVVIAAAGNQTALGQDLNQPQYPAALPGVIGVVATNASDAVYPWSFRGAWADVAAPGCVFDYDRDGQTDDGEICGTSFASPAVAGALGLVRSLSPEMDAAAIESALYATATPITSGAVASGRMHAGRLVADVPAVRRVAGANRIATAVALSQLGRSSASAVIIARADNYADALAAAPLAGSLGAPVLLTTSDSLNPLVAAEISRLGATAAWLAGGVGALSPEVENGLRSIGVADIHRLAGASRYDTARLIAQQVGGTSLFVTQAGAWADAVAVSGLAATLRAPILLVDRDGVPAETTAAIASLGASKVTIVGGPGVIGDAVAGALASSGATVDRLAGGNRYETSAAIAQATVTAGANAAQPWVATGTDWPDALAAGPAAAATGSVLRLVDGRDAGIATSSWSNDLEGFTVVGGTLSMTTDVVHALIAALV